MWKWMRRRRWQLLLGTVTGILLWVLALPPEDHQRLEKALGPGFSALVRVPAGLSSYFRGGLERVGGLWEAELENRRLREELALLKIEYHQLQETHLRSLARGKSLRTGGRLFSGLKPARLLGRDPSSWFNLATLDAGSQDDVRAGDGVLNSQGVVGKVVSVTSSTSLIRFLTDQQSRIAIRVRRSGVAAVLSGDGRGGCHISYLAGQDDVKVGDLVETAPAGLSFPTGVPVGEIVVVEKVEDGLKLRAEVSAFAKLSKLNNLYVARRRP